MSTLTIASPGVQINEVDLSQISQFNTGVNVFITGFANQGPTNTIVNVTSLSDFESTFGTPTNAAERYLYQSAKQLLNASPANLLVTRMPYGSGAGAGYSNQYSALVYPVSSNAATYSASNQFLILPPASVLLTDAQYTQIVENNAVVWSTGYNSSTIQSFNDIQTNGGLIVLDSAKTALDDLYQGYYVGLCDNSNVNPATDFVAITSVQAANFVSGSTNTYQTFVAVPSSRFAFSLTQSFSAGGTSISQIIEQFPTTYNFSSNYYNDCLTLMVFRIKTSTYAQSTVTLDASVVEGYTGSLYQQRLQNNPMGGAPLSFNLNNIANQASNDIKVITNPYISNTGTWVNADGTIAKTVRVANNAKNLYSQGVYIANTDQFADNLGNIPQKLQRVLTNLDIADVSLDVVAECGLGTIWANANAKQIDTNYGNNNGLYYFDETYNLDLTALLGQSGGLVGGTAYNSYQDIATQFITFASSTRKDHIFIADPLRNIFVQGANTKQSSVAGFNFSTNIYWPLQNLYAPNTTSYAATYGNWLLVNDVASNQNVWIPASGFVAAAYASITQAGNPWDAPAGYGSGTLNGVIDIAITPTQKQRDLLYRINVNPIAYFSGEGIVIFGQKTLYTKPSAFDRINVRRLFLSLEKATRNALRYYVFQPNTYTTQTRLVNTLKPLFDKALNSNGLYAYKIVCDARNNPPSVIDNNQLNVAIYIQPVRTAEFILCDFIATQTGVNFDEIIGQGTF